VHTLDRARSAVSRVPLVGWLFPSPDEPGAAIARRTRLLLTIYLSVANLIGAVIVFVLLGFALPSPPVVDSDELLLINLAVTGGYLAMGVLVGAIWGGRLMRPLREWLRSDRSATEEERITVLRAPLRIVRLHVILWGGAAVVFGVLNFTYAAELGLRVAMTIALGGLTTCATAYLVTERGLRPAAARALAEGVTERQIVPGVKARALLAWVLGTGIPVAGVAMVAISTLVQSDFTADQLAVAVLVLAGIAAAVGFYLSVLAARSVADPVRGVQDALEEVEQGNLDVEVPVYDGSELGLLQAGFNRMMVGLRERERIHDLFGRHVGEDVARAALEEDVELGGETREVSVLFVDLVGSTTLATERPPQEVVELLNAFFGIVVDVVDEHGGWVNKFEGDAALAIFGAPVPMEDHADRALACARELCERLSREVDGAAAGIGVSSGEVVAGNIGEEKRFEYTVIGDPVNEAARLTELAKSEGGVLASGSALERAADGEVGRWEEGEAVELRGRSTETRPAKPKS
jgi:adenylate cyclase